MSYRPPGTLRVLRLLAWTSLLRLLRAARINQAKRAVQRAAAGRGPTRRRATARKRSDGLMWLIVLMLPLFLFQAVLMTGQAVGKLQLAAEAAAAAPAAPVPAEPDSSAEPGEGPRLGGRYGGRVHPEIEFLAEPITWRNPEAGAIFVQSGTALLLALFGMLLAVGFGGANANLAGGEWTQAWLLTFPVPTRSLVLAKGLEYGIVAFFPWLTLCPLMWQMLRALAVPGALWIALGATLATTFLTGAFRLWIETKLRLSCTLRTLRSVQGACTLIALLLMALVFGVCLGPDVPQWFVRMAASTPGWLALLPGAWPLAIPSVGTIAPVLGVGATVAAFALAVAGTSRLLRGGAMRSGGVDAGARGSAGSWKRTRRLTVAGKDVALLLRDRNFLVQTVIVPVFVIGLQLVVNPGLGRVAGRGIAPLAYGIGLYALIGGCFQVLSAEGRALWMLYALPVSVAEVLRKKTRIWASLAVGYGLAGLVAFTLRGGGPIDAMALVWDALSVGFGIWCAAHIAAGVSVLGCNPAADYVPRQPKARHVYLYFFFASTFFVGISSQDWSLRIAATTVFATLAYAIWQRACDRLPWLLDPIVERRDRIGVYDGAAAVLVFFLLQALLLLVLLGIGGGLASAASTSLFLAFAIGGAITVLVFVAMLASRGVDLGTDLALRVANWPRAFGAVAAGVGLGAGAGIAALGYLRLNARYGWFELPEPTVDAGVPFLLLAVVAAPVVEELLFRGLVLGGLLRGVRPAVAIVWSAALFAVVHPAHSWAPVFVVGVLAAVLVWLTRFLPAAMLLHATYNFLVVTWR